MKIIQLLGKTLNKKVMVPLTLLTGLTLTVEQGLAGQTAQQTKLKEGSKKVQQIPENYTPCTIYGKNPDGSYYRMAAQWYNGKRIALMDAAPIPVPKEEAPGYTQ